MNTFDKGNFLGGSASQELQHNFDSHLSIKGTDLLSDSFLTLAIKNKLSSSLATTEEYLTKFAHNSLNDNRLNTNGKQTLNVIYGNDYNAQIATNIISNWGNNNFSQLPTIEVLPQTILNTALGAFASNNKIYLNQDFILQGSKSEIAAVMLEEIGHYLDAKINKFDAPGDEGNIFSKLVQGESISLNELNNLKLEDDHSQINIGGTIINIEQALPVLNITATDNNAAETKLGETANPGQFTITRSGASLGALTVNYTVSGTAAKGIDYNSLTGFVTFASGASTAVININPIDDNLIEDNESVILTLNNSSAYSLGTNSSATVTIADNDKTVINIIANDNNAGETKTGETPNPGQFTLTRTGNTAAGLTVNYTVGGTATKGVDYNSLTGSVTFASGVSTALININPIDDTTLEDNETVILTLSNSSAYNLGTNSSATVTIADNDKPVINITATDNKAAETKTGETQNPGQFTLTRTGNLNSTLTANYTVGGNATKAVDYNNLTGTVTFAAGSSTALININPIDDNLIEDDESVSLTLTGSNSYNLGTNSSATVTITDNDKPVINITATDNNAGERKTGETQNPGQFTLTRTGNLNNTLTANYTVGGSATKGVDYNNLTGTVTFAAGSSTALININPIDDNLIEDDENVILTLTGSNNYNLGTNSSATVTIADNDKPIIDITATQNKAAETLKNQQAKNGLFTLTRANNISDALTVNYTIGGTATKGVDYNNLTGTVTFAAGASTATIAINPIDDNLIEGTENVALTLNASNAYSLGAKTTAIVALADNDPIISVEATDADAAETATGVTKNPGVFTLKRTGANTDSLTVNYTLSGTATNGVDYNNLSGTITFAAGSSSATININPIDDDLIEGGEDAILTLSPSGSNTYSLDPDKSTATVTIADNDKPVISIQATDSIAAETLLSATPNPGQFTLTRTGIPNNSLTVNYTIAGTATNATDYNNLSGTATFAAGSSTAIINVNVIDDDLIEGNESVILTLSESTNYVVDSDPVKSTATVTIQDNEKPTISVAGTDGAETKQKETKQPGTFTLTRTGETINPLTVNYSISGTATQGVDYSNLTGTATFAKGATTATVKIDVIDDQLIEGDETVTLTLSPSTTPTPDYLLDTTLNNAEIIIKDNDQATINIDTKTSNRDIIAREKKAGETSNPGVFVLTRTGDLTSPLTVNFSVSGTATSPDGLNPDYTVLGQDGSVLPAVADATATYQVTFAAGSSTAKITINPIDDNIKEDTETVTIALVADANNVKYALGKTTTDTLQIFDNDVRDDYGTDIYSSVTNFSLLVKLPLSNVQDANDVFKDYAQSDLIGAVGVYNVIPYREGAALSQWRVLYFKDAKSLNSAKINLSGVEIIETNATALKKSSVLNNTGFTPPNDTRFNELWALNNYGQGNTNISSGGILDADIDAVEAWNITKGSNSVVVAVLDSGVDFRHPDLAANMWHNTREYNNGNGVDDDGNGYIDDYYGYDFVNNDSSPLDDAGHGTHVAGTIGARGDNNLGVIGVSPIVQIMPIKFLGAVDGQGGTLLQEARGINYAIVNGAKIINASYGKYGVPQPSSIEYDAISDANNKNILFVAAAGNDAFDNDILDNLFDLPATLNQFLSNIISVAATDNKDGLASFSNYGATTVDLGAPGVAILSTLPTLTGETATIGGKYGYKDGTSMAAPHVSGAAALLLAKNPNLTPSQIRNILMTTGDSVSSLQGKTVSGKRLNVYNALASISNTGLTNPTLQGTYNTPGLAWDVQAVGNYAYVADRESGLRIIDVSNPSNPVLTGKYDTPGFALDVKVVGNYAYVADGNAGLQILDISNPSNPVLKKNFGGLNQQPFSHFTNAVEVEIKDNYAYVLDSELGLQVLDISNPINPVWKSFYNTLGQANDLEIVGNYAYIADGASGLKVIDISNPLNPVFSRYYETPGYASRLSVVGNYAYVADGNAGLEIIDLTKPGNSNENSLTTEEDMNNAIAGKYQTYGVAYDVKIKGNSAYVIDQGSGLQIIDLTNLKSPFLRGKYDSSGLAYGLAFAGNYLYLADGEAGLKVLKA